MPFIIFATGYDEFALRAFDANAIDYLLKPVAGDRLQQSLNRARERIGTGTDDPVAGASLRNLLQGLAVPGTYKERFAVRSGNQHLIVRTADILWIEAADNYVRLHTVSESHLLRATMIEMEQAVDPRRFMRIHRSVLVAVDHVQLIEAWGIGEHVFVLSDGTKLTSSRRYRREIKVGFGL
jgi:two-component system LytT family response regulator